jgi:hypothetical protein
VSISELARGARDAEVPALADVRWYRAVRAAAVRGPTARQAQGATAGTSAGVLPDAAQGAARRAQAAIAAYVANMPLVA